MMHVSGQGGMEKLVLEGAGGARCELYLHGAHVTSWIPAGGKERLFLSERSEYRSGAPIRGGIPVVFPQFAGLGPLPKHGFARTSPWEVVEVAGGLARLRLRDSGATRALWPHLFEVEARIELAGTGLSVALAIANRGTAALSFTAALHTYLHVVDLEGVAVEGLQGVAFRENRPDALERPDPMPAIRFADELDRMYFGAPRLLTVSEPQRTTEIRAEGFPDAVVWNPGPSAGGRLLDLEPNGWRHFVCVEAAALRPPVVLPAGKTWRGAQVLRAAGM